MRKVFCKSCMTGLIMFAVFCAPLYPHAFNDVYSGDHLDRVAFPLGGIGAGMIALDGKGSFSHLSVRHQPDIFNEPFMFAAISVKGYEHGAKVLEGAVPRWKLFGVPNAGNGGSGAPYGLPRFEHAEFLARFPFAAIALSDQDVPLAVEITGWSPFVPTEPDLSSLPVAGIEYKFVNQSAAPIEAVFSFNSKNIMKVEKPSEWGGTYEAGDAIMAITNGYCLHQDGMEGREFTQGDFAVFILGDAASVDHCWFRGGWFDSVTMTWNAIEQGQIIERPPIEGSVPGASLFVPFQLAAKEEKTIRLLFSWFVPTSELHAGSSPQSTAGSTAACCCTPDKCRYRPWYASKFNDVKQVADYWRKNYDDLRQKSVLFRDAFFSSTLPPEVLEAVSANLTILKSPTVLRQFDGRLWAWEGCHDLGGCCYGSCTHVWNYAQAIPHLFPSLERTLRETEFMISQNEQGHQTFRANLPISTPEHGFYAAADGQLGGILKMYREWRISGNDEWLRKLWPSVQASMAYCMNTWDPRGKGVIEEPHHNTYDIEFWGPEGMCTSFYLGALQAMIRMGNAMGADVSHYADLYQQGKKYLETRLYNGEYFFQKITWSGLQAKNPVDMAQGSWTVEYSPEAIALLNQEGPKYQYGNGCLSDGIIGAWMAQMCGLGEIVDPVKVKSHLASVFRYNFKEDLSDHANPQRPTFANGRDGGLLLCTWPHGGRPSLPFVYSNEVWTGIEYQVASHLILQGAVEEGLNIVRTCRRRYDGVVRNPFNEYECGHWYARALSSYGLLQSISGIRYDAVDKILHLRNTGDNFSCFFSTETGFGVAGMKNGTPFYTVSYGFIDVKEMVLDKEKL